MIPAICARCMHASAKPRLNAGLRHRARASSRVRTREGMVFVVTSVDCEVFVDNRVRHLLAPQLRRAKQQPAKPTAKPTAKPSVAAGSECAEPTVQLVAGCTPGRGSSLPLRKQGTGSPSVFPANWCSESVAESDTRMPGRGVSSGACLLLVAGSASENPTAAIPAGETTTLGA
jgi:hypothetical protein